jgi:hypothetical protein
MHRPEFETHLRNRALNPLGLAGPTAMGGGLHVKRQHGPS